MDGVLLEHNELKQNLTVIDNGNDRQQPLISRINLWELKSIEKIKQVANEVRQQLRVSTDQSNKIIKESLDRIAEELRENQQIQAFTELNLTKWKNQLKQLIDQLANAPLIEIKHDEDETSSTHLPLIQLQMIPENIVSAQSSYETRGWTVADHPDQRNDPSMNWLVNATQSNMIGGGYGHRSQDNQFNLDPTTPFYGYNNLFPGYFHGNEIQTFNRRRIPTPKPSMMSNALFPLRPSKKSTWSQWFSK